MFAAGTPHGRSPNEQSRLELSVSLAKYGSVAIDPVVATYGTPFDRATRDGRTYSDKAPGLSLLGVPVLWLASPFLPREDKSDLPSYWSARHLLTWLLVTLPATLFPFLALNRYGSKLTPRKKNGVILLFALITPVLTYSGVLFGHVPAGVLAGLAWLLAQDQGRESWKPSAGGAAISGLLLAAAATIEYPTAIVGPVLLLTMALHGAPVRTLAAFAGAFAVGLVPCLIYHDIAFGSPFRTGYAFKSDWWHGTIHQTGFAGVSIPRFESLWGVLAGARRGMLFYCPLLILVPLGLLQMERQKKNSSWPFIAMGVLYILFAAGFLDWQAGWSAAARHLVPFVFLCIFPLASAVELITRPGQNAILQWVLSFAAGWSLAGTFLSLSLSPFFPEHFSSPLGQLVLPALAEGYFAPTLLAGSDLAYRGYAIALLCLVVSGAVSFALAGLMTVTFRAAIPLSLLAAALLFTGLVRATAPEPLQEDQLQMRADVLRHIGYGSVLQGTPSQ